MKGFLPSWLAPNETQSNKKTAPRLGRPGSANGSGAGSRLSGPNAVSEESIRAMMATAQKGTNQPYGQATGTNGWANQQFGHAATKNRQMDEDFQVDEVCTRLLRKHGITSWESYKQFVEDNNINKVYNPRMEIPYSEMRNIETCAFSKYGKMNPGNLNVALGAARMMAEAKKAAEAKAELERRQRRHYGGKRKNKTKRSQKTKRQTRRR